MRSQWARKAATTSGRRTRAVPGRRQRLAAARRPGGRRDGPVRRRWGHRQVDDVAARHGPRLALQVVLVGGGIGRARAGLLPGHAVVEVHHRQVALRGDHRPRVGHALDAEGVREVREAQRVERGLPAAGRCRGPRGRRLAASGRGSGQRAARRGGSPPAAEHRLVLRHDGRSSSRALSFCPDSL